MSKRINIVSVLILYMTVITPIIVILYSMSRNTNFYLLKEIVYAALVGCTPIIILYNRVTPQVIMFLVPAFLFLLVNFVFSDANLFTKLASLRQFLASFCFVAIGYYFTKNKEDLDKILKATLIAIIIILIFGFVERFTLLWQYIDVYSFYRFKGIPVSPNGYPYFWIEPVNLLRFQDFSTGIVRMVSTLLDPVNLGHFFVFAFAFICYEENLIRKIAHRNIFLLFIFIGLLLTFSKGAWLQFVLALVIFNKDINIAFRFVGFIVGALFVIILSLIHPGFWAHYFGFINVFNHLSITGNGIGTFGNYASMYNPEFMITGVGDSYWASVIGQFGIVGICGWLLFYLKISYDIRPNYLSRVVVSQLLVAALSENSFNVMSVFYALVLLGAFLKRRHNFLTIKFSI